jgi:hypothetical protein
VLTDMSCASLPVDLAVTPLVQCLQVPSPTLSPLTLCPGPALAHRANTQPIYTARFRRHDLPQSRIRIPSPIPGVSA